MAGLHRALLGVCAVAGVCFCFLFFGLSFERNGRINSHSSNNNIINMHNKNSYFDGLKHKFGYEEAKKRHLVHLRKRKEEGGAQELGVNIFGWIRGDFGGGRTVRAVAIALHASSVPFSTVEISGASLHSTSNTAIEELGFPVSPRKEYAFDLLVINAANTISTLCSRENDISQDHYRIGLWHWETSHLPLVQGAYGRYYNEIWVPTQYVADAIFATPSFPANDVKVVVLPYGYESLPRNHDAMSRSLAEQKLRNRAELPLVLKRLTSKYRHKALYSPHAEEVLNYWANTELSVTLFLVIFDFNSDYNRKNIVATVKTFLKAFPSLNGGKYTNTSAGLIIKSINAESQMEDYNRLQWLLGGGDHQAIPFDERIILMNGLSSEGDLEKLKLAVDCYVSLHRSEGLGLNIIEAILIGVPVISSAYSGSEQYMRKLYGQLAPELRIPTEVVQVDREFGPYTYNMTWGQPSEAAAVNAMRLIFSYRNYYANMASRAIRQKAIQLLSPPSTGAAMKKRLQVLFDCINAVQSKLPGADLCLKKVLGLRRKVNCSEKLQLSIQ